MNIVNPESWLRELARISDTVRFRAFSHTATLGTFPDPTSDGYTDKQSTAPPIVPPRFLKFDGPTWFLTFAGPRGGGGGGLCGSVGRRGIPRVNSI